MAARRARARRALACSSVSPPTTAAGCRRASVRAWVSKAKTYQSTPPAVSTPVHINGQYVAWAIESVDEGGEEAIVYALNARTGRILHELVAPQRFEDELVSSVTEVGVAADGSLVYLQLEGSPARAITPPARNTTATRP